jgi:hypothetical protein
MKKRAVLIEVFPQEGHPYFWFPHRVPQCPQKACRRAGRCVRPRMVEGRGPPRWPSCPLVTDREWAVWGREIYLAMQKILARGPRAKEAGEAEADPGPANRPAAGAEPSEELVTYLPDGMAFDPDDPFCCNKVTF